jgi:GAF domain-containing protein
VVGSAREKIMAEKLILIADGNPNTVPKPASELREMGYEMASAGDAFFVQSMALRYKPSVVILGAKLAAGGALAALRKLRGSVHTTSIPVVALASPGAEKQALLSAGADKCIEPPVSDEDLVIVLSNLLGFARPVTEAPAEILADPERLSALGETTLLDRTPNEALDILTRMASEVLGVPVALVSLVDDHRQFFKSHIGLPEPWKSRQETPLTHSFCQWVVSSKEELVIEDARKHTALRDNGAVSDIGVIAYAGVPLSSGAGQTIGSFCAIDGKPHPWSDAEMATLRDLAQVADAHTALNLVSATDQSPEVRDQRLQVATQAAGRGFLGIARLLRRNRPVLNDAQRRDLTWFIERNSHRLIELAGESETQERQQTKAAETN